MCNNEDTINFKSLSLKLHDYIQLKEEKELIVFLKEHKFSIFPQDSIGNPVEDVSARPVIECRFDKKTNTFILSWIYLIKHRQGICSEIISIIIDFCRTNRISRFQIKTIKHDNEAMLAIGKKYDFRVISHDEEYFNLSLDII